jgi:transposase-like protein
MSMREATLQIVRSVKEIERCLTPHATEGEFSPIICPFCGATMLIHANGAAVCSSISKPPCKSLKTKWRLALVEG